MMIVVPGAAETRMRRSSTVLAPLRTAVDPPGALAKDGRGPVQQRGVRRGQPSRAYRAAVRAAFGVAELPAGRLQVDIHSSQITGIQCAAAVLQVVERLAHQ